MTKRETKRLKLDDSYHTNRYFYQCYRNIFIRKRIFSYLGESRTNYYAFVDSDYHHNIYDSKFITENSHEGVIRDQIKRFKATHYDKDTPNKIKKGEITRGYKDWIDFSILSNIKIKLTNNNHNHKSAFKDLFKEIESICPDDKKIQLVNLLFNHQLGEVAVELFDQYILPWYKESLLIDALDAKTRELMLVEGDDELFQRLVEMDKVTINLRKYSEKMSHLAANPFFQKNRDCFRKISTWKDEEFINRLLQQPDPHFCSAEIYDDTIKWYIQCYKDPISKPLGKTPQPSSLHHLCGLEFEPFIIPNQNKIPLAFATTSLNLWNYATEYYQLYFELFYKEESFIIIDEAIIEKVLEFSKKFSIPLTIKIEINNLKLLEQVDKSKLDYYVTNTENKQILEYLFQHRPERLNVLNLKEPYLVDIFKMAIDLHKRKGTGSFKSDTYFFSGLFLKSIREGRIDYTKYHVSQIGSLVLYEILSATHPKTLEYIYQDAKWLSLFETEPSKSMALLPMNLNLYNVDLMKLAITNLKPSNITIQETLLNTYKLLSSAKREEKERAIAIIEYLKTKHQPDHFKIQPDDSDNWELAFLQDPIYCEHKFKSKKSSHIKMEYFQDLVANNDLSRLKFIVNTLNEKELVMVNQGIHDLIVKNLPLTKTLLYLIETFSVSLKINETD
ncbi:hypothetical protein CYY_008601 [Polysphondylium violaceum]|uniref:Uncharacterized protein n=1 Tax=Polysphondylium violaceum TaxID=133409 RepID=A0A8J4PLC1_9MYCE|nr:hypothetical protein CYY_008601 [Polysphondylium violaceum]